MKAAGSLFCLFMFLTVWTRDASAAEDIVSLRQRAEAGDAIAQFSLGLCYIEGRGVTKDYSEGIKWYRKAAEQRNPRAQCGLGLCYARGEGVSKNVTEAATWFRKAADQGHPGAQYGLGVYYALGEDVPKDMVEAAKWYRKAAEQGYAEAQFALGTCYQTGEGLPKDATEAAKWLRKAAEQGYPKRASILPILGDTPEQIESRLGKGISASEVLAIRGCDASRQYETNGCRIVVGFVKGEAWATTYRGAISEDFINMVFDLHDGRAQWKVSDETAAGKAWRRNDDRLRAAYIAKEALFVIFRKDLDAKAEASLQKEDAASSYGPAKYQVSGTVLRKQWSGFVMRAGKWKDETGEHNPEFEYLVLYCPTSAVDWVAGQNVAFRGRYKGKGKLELSSGVEVRVDEWVFAEEIK